MNRNIPIEFPSEYVKVLSYFMSSKPFGKIDSFEKPIHLLEWFVWRVCNWTKWKSKCIEVDSFIDNVCHWIAIRRLVSGSYQKDYPISVSFAWHHHLEFYASLEIITQALIVTGPHVDVSSVPFHCIKMNAIILMCPFDKCRHNFVTVANFCQNP